MAARVTGLPNPPTGRELLPNLALNPRLAPLAATGYKVFRDNQVDAILQVTRAFLDGERMVVLEGPVGSGKTLIAEATRLILGVRGGYVCSSKDLQDQFAESMGAPVLKGRGNYLPTRAGGLGDDISCEDCDLDPNRMIDPCTICEPDRCPYLLARDTATRAPVAALNTHYWLSATHQPDSPWSHRGLTVFDEADELESVLLSSAEIYIPESRAAKWGIDPPSKLTIASSHEEWAHQTLPILTKRILKLQTKRAPTPAERKELRVLFETRYNVDAMLKDIADGYPWVYTGGAGSTRRHGDKVVFRPVSVSRYGRAHLWGKSPRYLLMSGSILSAGTLLSELGWDGEYAYIAMPSTFSVQNRQVIACPVADMSRASQARGREGGPDPVAALVNKITSLLADEPGRALVHAYSYALAEKVSTMLAARVGPSRTDGLPPRVVITYADARGRAGALERYKATPGAVLVASSMERGIDLPDDLCRLQVIAKVPYPSLGDKQVAARLYAPGGKVWYAVQVARSIMQMCGRGVRHDSDHAVTWVLDAGFRQHWDAWQRLYPRWFRDGLRWKQ